MVVVTTGTLSLGINTPCKIVVPSGDCVYLTMPNFRQASGRAGRRSFDLLRNVVFQGVGCGQGSRLLSSQLPDLNGHVPFITSFVLRLLGLLHRTKIANYAIQMVNSLLSHPRLYLGDDSFRHPVLHRVRFSIQYLCSQGLAGRRG
jgi:ATP-dependent RNA helicase DDX60